MPRSTNPNNYEETYFDLLEGMKQEIGEIKLNLPANLAQKVKYTFYAFIRALEAQSQKQHKKGDFIIAGELEQNANAMRKYLVEISIDEIPLLTIQRTDQRPVTLKFINRDLNPATASMREQIKEQINLIPIPQITRQVSSPPVDSFFPKPLELKDDGTT